jgi:hypothetical protein
MTAYLTPHLTRVLGGLLLGLLALAYPATGLAQSATISLDLVGTPELTTGVDPDFQVRVYVSFNDTETTPSGANLRLTFDSDFVVPVADDPGEGIYGIISNDGYTVAKSAVQGTAPNNYINLFIACPENSGMTPELCIVEFTVIQPGSFSIGLEPDPAHAKPFLNVTIKEISVVPFIEVVTTEITPTTYDSVATQNLEATTTVSDWALFEY